MQQAHGVAVLSTNLALTDRRALSQAWYSALHVAERAAPPARPARRPDMPCRGNSAAPRTAGADAREQAARVALAGASRATRPPRDGATAADRRSPRSELTRRIVTAFAQRAPRETPASFSVRAAGGRVHLLIRSDGNRLRIVAVCSAKERERVDRALAQARFALAAAGRRVEIA